MKYSTYVKVAAEDLLSSAPAFVCELNIVFWQLTCCSLPIHIIVCVCVWVCVNTCVFGNVRVPHVGFLFDCLLVNVCSCVDSPGCM